MISATEHPHISRDDSILSGEPIIKGTRTPVPAIVEIWRMGVPPEDITTHLPHLNLAQIFDALSYFADHPDEGIISSVIASRRMKLTLAQKSRELILYQSLSLRNHYCDSQLSLPHRTPIAVAAGSNDGRRDGDQTLFI